MIRGPEIISPKLLENFICKILENEIFLLEQIIHQTEYV
jgi:hypothetical protein